VYHVLPQGDETTSTNWISLHLMLVHTQHAQVKVHLALSLLDNAGEPVSPHIMPKDFMFIDANYTSGFAQFIERKALEESPYTFWMIAPESDVMHSKKNHGGA
jgi:hypothetical protein